MAAPGLNFQEVVISTDAHGNGVIMTPGSLNGDWLDRVSLPDHPGLQEAAVVFTIVDLVGDTPVHRSKGPQRRLYTPRSPKTGSKDGADLPGESKAWRTNAPLRLSIEKGPPDTELVFIVWHQDTDPG